MKKAFIIILLAAVAFAGTAGEANTGGGGGGGSIGAGGSGIVIIRYLTASAVTPKPTTRYYRALKSNRIFK